MFVPFPLLFDTELVNEMLLAFISPTAVNPILLISMAKAFESPAAINSIIKE